LEAHQDELDFRSGAHQLSRAEAIQTLAQFPLREVERELLDELFTELGQLAKTPNRLARRLHDFGFDRDPEPAVQLVQRLLRGLGAHSVTPPSPEWTADNRIGLPEGQELPKCLDSLRLLVNYWDQCLVRHEEGDGPQRVRFPPGNWVAPAGSYRSGGGGNETVEAFETTPRSDGVASPRVVTSVNAEQAPKVPNVGADPLRQWGRPPTLASRSPAGIRRPTSDPTQRSHRGI
jgi:hypothetical protein